MNKLAFSYIGWCWGCGFERTECLERSVELAQIQVTKTDVDTYYDEMNVSFDHFAETGVMLPLACEPS